MSTLKLIADPAAHATTREFADAMSRLASGVVLVTCRVGDRPWGTTVTAFASVSADPPTILVSLGADATSVRAIKEARRFGVSILANDQEAVAHHGSIPGAAKFLERFVEARGAAGLVIPGALAHLECELSEIVEVADHAVIFGRVRAARIYDDGPPLVYHDRAYGTVCEAPEERRVGWLSS